MAGFATKQKVKDVVDLETMDPDNLKDHEARWLQDHGILPDGYDAAPVYYYLPDGTKVSNDPAVFAQQAQMLASGDAELDELQEAKIQALALEMAEEIVRAQQHQTTVGGQNHGNAGNTPAGGSAPFPPVNNDQVATDDDSDEPEDEDYEDGWNNDQRRAELSRRGLDVEGNKDELISRLLQSDSENTEG